jgi:hypothetical protein
MSASAEIVRAYKGFGASMRRRLDEHPGEERLLIYLVIAILLFFVARIPNLLEVSAIQATEDISIAAIFVTNLVSSFFFAPLLLYGVAALSHLVAKAFGGKGTSYGARLALFWTLLVISPLALLSTILQVAYPADWLSTTLLTGMFLLFTYAWGTCLSVAEGFKSRFMTILVIILTVFGLTIAFRVFITG